MADFKKTLGKIEEKWVGLGLVAKGGIIGVVIAVIWSIIPYILLFDFLNLHPLGRYPPGSLFSFVLFYLISGVFGALCGWIFEKIGRGIKLKREPVLWLIWIVFLVIFVTEYTDWKIFFILFVISIVVYAVLIRISHKSFRLAILLTYLFTVTYLFGSGPIYPFGEHVCTPSGDTFFCVREFLPLVSVPLYPLASLDIEMFQTVPPLTGSTKFVPLLLIIIYYFIISTVVVSIYWMIRNKDILGILRI